MNAQKALVDTVGVFYPGIVKMDGAGPRQWKKQRQGGGSGGTDMLPGE